MASSFHIKVSRAEVDAGTAGEVNIALSGGLARTIRSLRLTKYSFVSDTNCDKLAVQIKLPFVSIGLHRTGVETAHILNLPLTYGSPVTIQDANIDLMMLEDRIPKSFPMFFSDEAGVAFAPAGVTYEINLWFDYVENIL